MCDNIRAMAPRIRLPLHLLIGCRAPCRMKTKTWASTCNGLAGLRSAGQGPGWGWSAVWTAGGRTTERER